MKKRYRAFTLIELLASVTIVAILGALLVPAVKGWVERSQSVACLANLKQIGHGVVLYAADNDQEVVYDIGGGNVTWVQSLSPYVTPGSPAFVPGQWNPSASDLGVRPTGVWACPASKQLTRQGGYSDYSKNSLINENRTTTVGWPRKNARLNSLRNPSKLILIGDSSHSAAHTLCGRGLGPWVTENNSGLVARHGKKANVLFYDFHIEPIDPTTLPSNSHATQNNPPWVDTAP